MASTVAAKKTSSLSAKKPSTPRASSARPKDACALLDADHKKVKALFKDYQGLVDSRSRSSAKKRQLADQICQELTIHATIEEEIFYPAVRQAIKDDALMNEATVEHASAKDLIAQIKAMDADEEMFDAKVTVLGEYIDHHVKEERKEMFAKARKTKLDLVKLGEQLLERKQALMTGNDQAGVPPGSRKTATAL